MKKNFMRITDGAMGYLLLFLMAYQVTGAAAHEWLGMAMLALIVAHNILNRRWYPALFRGRYTLFRLGWTVVNVLLIASMLATMVSGILLNSYVLPLSIHGTMATARVLHLAGSYWSFVLMSLHLGLHGSALAGAVRKWNRAWRVILGVLAAGVAVYGGVCFTRADILTYMTFQTHFAFLDYERSPALVLGDQLAMMVCWALIGWCLGAGLRALSKGQKARKQKEDP